MKTTAPRLIALTGLVGLAGLTLTACGTGPGTATAPNVGSTIEAAAGPSVDLDPRACYIDSTGPAVHPDAVELVCGNGSAVSLDVERTGDNSAYVEVTASQDELDGWTVENPEGAVHADGSTIVQIGLKKGDQDCSYYRPLGFTPEQTDTNCSGFDRKL